MGKTRLSISLAHAADGEIISADSMQVYRHMDIGSAKITKEEMDGIPHYLIDVLDPREEFHVVRFQQMAKEAIEAAGMTSQDFTVSSSNEIQTVVQSMVGKVDAIYAPTDNTIAAGMAHGGHGCRGQQTSCYLRRVRNGGERRSCNLRDRLLPAGLHDRPAGSEDPY